MSVPTVFLVGTDHLPMIPEYLNLGSVVVVSPDGNTLAAWRAAEGAGASTTPADRATVVDLEGRRILHGGASLPLSDLEFRVLGALLASPGRALSFTELRREGWGDGPELPVDIYSVRALIQRIRAKLTVASAPVQIVSVRGYGFRAELRPKPVEREPSVRLGAITG